jgi:ankyrin repeat protein
MNKIIINILIIALMASCSKGQNNMLGNDVNLYMNTEAWKLAQAVEANDTIEIRKICKKNMSLLQFQEPRFGQTLLEWAVYTNHFPSAKVLVELGADPNRQSYDGTSAFIHACDKNETSDYVKLLLKYGGDVNAIANPDTTKAGVVQQLKTPLVAAAGSNLESVKILVEAGAHINYKGEQWQSALHYACLLKKIDIIKYLVSEKEINLTKPLYVKLNGDTLYIHHLLRELRFPLESKEYNMKMEVVEYLKQRGLNYWEAKIPEGYYQLYSEEYLEKY